VPGPGIVPTVNVSPAAEVAVPEVVEPAAP